MGLIALEEFVIIVVMIGKVCDNCCDCFKNKKEDDKKEEIKGNEEIKEYEEIKDEGNNIAKSLVSNAWYNAKENKPILKIFLKKNDGVFPSKDNGDKISINLDKNNNPKIAYQKGAENEPNLGSNEYAFFEIKTKGGNTVYLYCSDVESSKNKYAVHGIFEKL